MGELSQLALGPDLGGNQFACRAVPALAAIADRFRGRVQHGAGSTCIARFGDDKFSEHRARRQMRG